MTLITREDIGFQAAQLLHEIWMVDENKCTWHQDGFDWWPSPFQVSVRVSEAVDVDGLTNYKLTVKTAFWKGVNLADSKHLFYVTGLQKQTSSYAPRIVDKSIARKLDVSNEGKLDLVSCVYVREDNFGWLPRLFAQLCIMQSIDASIWAPKVGADVGLKPDTSETPDDFSELDEILEIADQVYAPAGQTVSRWTNSEEFGEAAEQLNHSDYFFANSDGSGLTAESAFLDDTALIRVRADEPHPQLGNGLLVTLDLPILVDDILSVEPSAYNVLESWRFTCVPLLGSWCTHQLNEGKICMAFSMFIPNALYMPGLVMNLALWMHGRAQWSKSEFFTDREDTPLVEVLNKRYRTISES